MRLRHIHGGFVKKAVGELKAGEELAESMHLSHLPRRNKGY